MGETKNDISNKGVFLKDLGNYWYTTDELPKGNYKLTKYDLLITPKSGLCRIISYTDIMYSNSFGDQLKNEFEFFEKALIKNMVLIKNMILFKETACGMILSIG